jgi:hypothetical protein
LAGIVGIVALVYLLKRRRQQRPWSGFLVLYLRPVLTGQHLEPKVEFFSIFYFLSFTLSLSP